jgi:hypothetical protein
VVDGRQPKAQADATGWERKCRGVDTIMVGSDAGPVPPREGRRPGDPGQRSRQVCSIHFPARTVKSPIQYATALPSARSRAISAALTVRGACPGSKPPIGLLLRQGTITALMRQPKAGRRHDPQRQ